jgi:hypothetical protein
MNTVRSLWWIRERSKQVRLGKDEAKKHIIKIITSQRDPKTEKIVYDTIESFDVFDATDAEVKEAVVRGISGAAKKQ